MKPFYLYITPRMGELVWNKVPSDELLTWQLGYKNYLEQQYATQVLDLRMGFTRINMIWKTEKDHLNFRNSFENFELQPFALSEKTWEVPVCYESGFAPDLINLADLKQLTLDQLIEIHASPTYRIHFFGFLPGFFYLNGLPEILHTPRKSIPNLTVPKGSVAIGGSQTGIYPGESPGGWHLIGRTPLSLFHPQNNPPVWAKPGDRIKFVPINGNQFQNWPNSNPRLRKE